MSDGIPLAVIGGSGFYEMPGLTGVEQFEVDTPFGAPSAAIQTGTLRGLKVAFLARHGRGHSLLPSDLPQRANFWALKSLGVRRVLAVSAVGSLREDYRPGEFVLPDQIIDRTGGLRPATFFGSGVVAHLALADPFCPVLRNLAGAAAETTDARVNDGGTYVVIEGPAFGTRAESHLYRSWGASVVGMTALPEAKLAREAEICYAILAAVTDYDSWHEEEDEVTANAVFETLQRNVEAARRAVTDLAERLAERAAPDPCGCGTALDAALVTPPGSIASNQLERLRPILARRLAGDGA